MIGYILRINSLVNGTSYGDLDTELSKVSVMDTFCTFENQATGKVQSCNVKDIVLEPPVEIWNIDTQFGKAGKDVQLPCKLTYYIST